MLQHMNKIKVFNDIYTVAEDLDKKEKGDLFELITFYLFKLDPRLNNILLQGDIWMYYDVPNNILE
jgi:hypothetical protein